MLLYRTPSASADLFMKLVSEGLSWARAWTIVQKTLHR